MNEANGGSVIYHFKADDNDLQNKLDGVKKGLSTFGKVTAGLSATVAGASVLASGALINMSKNALSSYAEVEQSIGGIETLFGSSAEKVIQNAQKAYKTAGVDANTYMQGVASFSASLLQSTGNNAEKSAEIADMAFQDMSDNANKFGTDMKSIEKAYQGFAKGQFNMLDNLKLGYGGTKTEMQRLLADAEKISGVKYDISNLADVYNAIHVIQGELGVTGTTAKEAGETLTGSINSAKMAWQNFLSGQGGVDEVVETVTKAGVNIGKALVKIFPQIAKGIVGIINGLIPMIPKLIKTLLPVLVSSVVSLMQGLAQALPSIIQSLSSLLPQIITTLIQGFRNIAVELGNQLPMILTELVNGLLLALIALIENADLIIEGAIALISGLANGLIECLPIIIEKLPDILIGIVDALINAAPMLIEAGIALIPPLIAGFAKAFPQFIVAAIDYYKKLFGELVKLVSNMKEIGTNMVKGLWNGLKGMKQWVIDKVKGMGKSILNGLKNVLGIGSPSKEFATVGKFSVLGYTESLDDMKGELNDAIQETFSLSPQLTNSAGLHYSPNVIVNNQMNMTTDPLGQVVGNIKTFANGSKNDFNYGMGV